MITSETYRGYRIVVGLADHTDTGEELRRFCTIQHLETGERLAREEFPAEITVEAAFEAARQRIVDEDLRREL